MDSPVVHEPDVLWLMPVRNGMPHLVETLASLAAQTHRNHALFVWDNASTDGTLEELHRWIPARLPGRVVGGEPLNVGETLARLVELAGVELCARIDADDVCEPDRLARQVAFLAAHPEVVAVGSRVRAIDGAGREITDHGWNLDYHLDDNAIVHDLLVRAAQRHPTMLMRRSAVLAAGNYAGLASSQDYDIQLRLARIGRLANLAEPLVRYRFHAGSQSQAMRDRVEWDREVRAPMFARSGAPLFGRPEAVLLRLKRCEHRFALPHLLAIARALERRHPMGLARRLGSRSFLEGARRLVAPRDRVTRAALAVVRRLAATAAPGARS